MTSRNGAGSVQRISRKQALIAGSAFLVTTATANAQALPTVRVVGPPNDGMKTVYYGIQSGIFKKHGINVVVTLDQSGDAATVALVGGSTDVAAMNVATLILGHDKGIPMQVVAPGMRFDIGNRVLSGLVTLTDSPIHSGRDLNGRTIGTISMGAMTIASVGGWIDKTGGDSKTVKMIIVPASSGVEMLKAGRISALQLIEPDISRAISSGNVRLFANINAAIANHFIAGLYAVMAPNAANQAAAMRAFAEGVHEAAMYTNSHLPETASMVSAYSGLSRDVVAKSARVIDAPYATPSMIQPVIAALFDHGQIKASFPAADVISPYALEAP